jgi:membrane-associated phospholipid phosphatase
LKLWRKRYRDVRFRLVDITCISYFSLIGFLLIFFHKNVPHWPLCVILHMFLILFILEIVRWGEKNRDRKILWFLRTFYPIAIILIAWGELDGIIPMFFGNYWATDVMIRFEKSIFGVLPTLWLQQSYQPWLDELMNILYSGYYVFIPLVSLTLYIKRKHEAALAAFSFAIFAYLTNYLFFFLLPALSPMMAEALADQNIGSWTGYVFADFTRFIQSSAGCRGATFPSSHISGVFMWSFVALRYQRPMGYVLMPFAFGVGMASSYLGYHYLLDSIFGFVWALICYPVVLKILKSRNEDPLSSVCSLDEISRPLNARGSRSG